MWQPPNPPSAGPVAAPVVDDLDWLARAGHLARQRAKAAREAAHAAAPVRSRLLKLLGVHTEERAWRIGADGEEKVAAQLQKLMQRDPRWRALHAIPVGSRGSDIDHVVIGPGGVFTLNAKHHPGARIWVGGGTFMVNVVRQPYVRNSRHEATRAARLLSAACGVRIEVRGVVVPVGARTMTIKTPLDDISVVPRRQLASWLAFTQRALDERTLELVYERARRSSTWR
ncbi:nuclease-related domain-containing protein [Modestobacter sp. URMC 112]